MPYKIITGTIEQVEKEVNEKLKDGEWDLFGFPQITGKTFADPNKAVALAEKEIAQALVSENDKSLLVKIKTAYETNDITTFWGLIKNIK